VGDLQSTTITSRYSKFTMDRARCSTASAASTRIAQRTQSVSFVTNSLLSRVFCECLREYCDYGYKLLNSVSAHQIRTLHISAVPLVPWRQVAIQASFHNRVCHSIFYKPHVVAQRPNTCGHTAYVPYVIC